MGRQENDGALTPAADPFSAGRDGSGEDGWSADRDSALDAISANDMPAEFGENAADMAFARDCLTECRVFAVLRPDFEESKRRSREKLTAMQKNPLMWPYLALAYPFLSGCASYNTKAASETFYILTDRGLHTIINSFDLNLLEWCSPRKLDSFYAWDQIASISTRATKRKTKSQNVCRPHVCIVLSHEAQRLHAKSRLLLRVAQPARAVKLLERVKLSSHEEMPMDELFSKYSAIERPKSLGSLPFQSRERQVWVCRNKPTNSKVPVMVHNDMSLEAFKSLALYAFDLDSYDAHSVTLFTVPQAGASLALKSVKDLEENQLVRLHII